MAMPDLYPYQQDGARWLAARKAALLADDMGLGKSAQESRGVGCGDGQRSSTRDGLWQPPGADFWMVVDAVFRPMAQGSRGLCECVMEGRPVLGKQGDLFDAER